MSVCVCLCYAILVVMTTVRDHISLSPPTHCILIQMYHGWGVIALHALHDVEVFRLGCIS